MKEEKDPLLALVMFVFAWGLICLHVVYLKNVYNWFVTSIYDVRPLKFVEVFVLVFTIALAKYKYKRVEKTQSERIHDMLDALGETSFLFFFCYMFKTFWFNS